MQRRELIVAGIVQGVGFRPFVYRLAARLQLAGFVRNEPGLVRVEVEGPSSRLDEFQAALQCDLPESAQIESVTGRTIAPLGEPAFRIAASIEDGGRPNFVSPDLATCDDCIDELFDPANRRFRYPFLSCAHCGPRLTILRGTPYDRIRTTMVEFELCADCRQEYENPADRRYHAEPIACPVCGPQLTLLDARGAPLTAAPPLEAAVAAMRRGEIVAVRGIGGFHLVCNAANETAVAALRQKKNRDAKPFALMVNDVVAARTLCMVNSAEQRLLESVARPIVLLRRHSELNRVAPSVAPGRSSLGIMLPYSPLHHLLVVLMDKHPLVVTSGNRSDEPIVVDNDEALRRLTGVADCFLVHDRPIQVRCDDSVARVIGDRPRLVRRSRGYAPRSLRLSRPTRQPLLAVGGQSKNAFALAVDDYVVPSHHVGDLDVLEAREAFEREIRWYEELFRIRPRVLVHDLHPDYASTRYALDRAQQEGLITIGVQHHHAHLASCLVEHGLNDTVIGITWDGAGYGIDEDTGAASVWGGEFLIGDVRDFRRVAYLRPVRVPGGERAAREPWRAAGAHLLDGAVHFDAWNDRRASRERRLLEQMIERHVNAPRTSSMGRLFDAVASLIGVCDWASDEGDAAVAVEELALQVASAESYPAMVTRAETAGRPELIDTRPIIAGVVADLRCGVDPRLVARRFHNTLTHIALEVCRRLRDSTQLATVVLSGGVFMNSILATELPQRLTADGFRVLQHAQLPMNDGGVCVGQAAIGAARC